jgi:hypothetical protein
LVNSSLHIWFGLDMYWSMRNMSIYRKLWSICTGYVRTNTMYAYKYSYGTHQPISIFIWLVLDGGYNKNVSSVENSKNILSFYYISIISRIFLWKWMMQWVEKINLQSMIIIIHLQIIFLIFYINVLLH